MRAWNLGLVAATLLLSGGAVATPAPPDNDCQGDSCGAGDSESQNKPNGPDDDNSGGVSGFTRPNTLSVASGVADLSATIGQNESSGDGEENLEGLEIPVATAYAPPIIATDDTCMGSRSAGAQGLGFGVSGATTWQDDNCRRLKNARQLVALGYRRAAVALLCVDDEVRTAMTVAGTPCPGGLQPIDTEPEPAAPAPVSEPLPSDFSVLFDFDSATLKPQATPALEQMLAALPVRAAVSVDVVGYADATGADAYNLALSRRRAQAVADWLIARGVAPAAVHVEAKGEAEPVARNETAGGRALNRRVEVSLHSSDS